VSTGEPVRVSEHYQLGRTQPTLDFVDVDVREDVPVFLDPRAARLLPSAWADECLLMLRTFFAEVLASIRTGDRARVRLLLSSLREPNETHLGLSVGASRGRGLGRGRGQDLADALSGSRAAQTGLLEDLEDSVLMVDGIGHDIVSDITTNVLRGQLIGYTQRVAGHYGIPLVPDVESGAVWHPHRLAWERGFVDLPVAAGGKLLLVPKALVRHRMDYDKDDYFRNYLTPILQDEELDAGSSLVDILRDGRRRVTKKAIAEKYGTSKLAVTNLTLDHVEALDRYRADKANNISTPLDHAALGERTGSDVPDFDALLADVRAVPTGTADATRYHHAVEALLTALFYPALVEPVIEHEIHEGRKRIDISYTNTARFGVFRWLAQHGVPSKLIFVECKNYGGEVANPELDQLSGRFSPLRGQVGILACRAFKDKELFLQRCRDTALDHRGFILALDDEDLGALVDQVKAGHGAATEQALAFSLLKRRYDALIT
jgi:hypothetical protein